MRLCLWFFLLSFALSVQAADKSIYEIDPAWDYSLIGAGALVPAIAYWKEDKWIGRRCPCAPESVFDWDRPAIGNHSQAGLVLSDSLLVASLGVPVVLNFSHQGWSETFHEDLVVYLQTLTTMGAVVTTVKYLVQRPLPRTYAGEPEYLNQPEGYRSFFSGHVSLTVAALTAAAFTWQWRQEKTSAWPWVIVGGTGALVAFGRVSAGVHFLSDVVVGGAAGLLVGYLIPSLHRRLPNGVQAWLEPLPEGVQFKFATRLN